ncbi:MAG TPA: GH32 C-terminal domain-containing protein, partial [Candidatus Acidoferrum sp.]
ILETRPETEFSAAGWAGCMALPRVLSLNSKDDLLMKVATPAEALREKKIVSVTPGTSTEERTNALRALTISNLAGELRWIVAAGAFSLTLADSKGSWWSLKISRAGAATTMQVNEKVIESPLPAASSGEHAFHLLLDGSVAEFFCDDLHVLTLRIYRQPSGPLHLQFDEGDLAALHQFQAWQLRPISSDRLTS